jgi:hypothetical protein
MNPIMVHLQGLRGPSLRSDRQITSDPKSERGNISTKSFLDRTQVVSQEAPRIHSLPVALPMYRFP